MYNEYHQSFTSLIDQVNDTRVVVCLLVNSCIFNKYKDDHLQLIACQNSDLL
jgi:hypothetical protein